MFYFNSDVWGTVSDWVMVSVTSITAYYLYQTLKAQKDVQRDQRTLTEIEVFRHRESIKPVFTFTKPHEVNYANDLIGYSASFTLTRQLAKNIEVFYEPCEGVKNFQTSPLKFNSLNLGSGIPFDIQYHKDLPGDLIKKESCMGITINIHFEDLLSNKYSQRAVFALPGGEIMYHIENPISTKIKKKN
jgi:hypothetical protein